MIARVKYQGKIYNSYVFAYFEYDYMPQYIVYDNENDKFEIVSNLSEKCDGQRQIGLMNENENDFIYKSELSLNKGTIKKFKGYSWLDDISLINNIDEDKKIDNSFHVLARKMNETIDPNKWNEVLTHEDAIDFMEHVGCFHDMYFIGMKATSSFLSVEDEAKLQLQFHSQGPFDVLVEFEGAINIKYTLTTCNRIYLSSIVFKHPNIYWLDGNDELTEADIENYEYISGQKLRWKYIFKDEEW